MSLPSFPTNDPAFTREDVINQIISSIALEELGLSHIINTEGEKLQYALGTLEGAPALTVPATVDDLLELNKSVRDTLESTMQNQMFLKMKMDSALSAPVMQGPIGPTGPPGTSPLVRGIQAELISENGSQIPTATTLIFDEILNNQTPDITYDSANGHFTLSRAGYYYITWWVAVDGAERTADVIFSVAVNDTPAVAGAAPSLTGQVVGSALITVAEAPATVSLVNISEDIVALADLEPQANITIIALSQD